MHNDVIERIEREVLSWPGVSKERRHADVTVYQVGQDHLGHIHHDGVADLPLPDDLYRDLIASGEAQPHRGGFAGVVSFHIRSKADVADAVQLFRTSYENIQGETDAAWEAGR